MSYQNVGQKNPHQIVGYFGSVDNGTKKARNWSLICKFWCCMRRYSLPSPAMHGIFWDLVHVTLLSTITLLSILFSEFRHSRSLCILMHAYITVSVSGIPVWQTSRDMSVGPSSDISVRHRMSGGHVCKYRVGFTQVDNMPLQRPQLFIRFWLDTGAPSTTLTQHHPINGLAYGVFLDMREDSFIAKKRGPMHKLGLPPNWPLRPPGSPNPITLTLQMLNSEKNKLLEVVDRGSDPNFK